VTRERDPDDKGNRHRIKLKPGEVCPKCHAVHEAERFSGTPRCQAHAKVNNAQRVTIGWRQCKEKAVDGLDVCRKHGGSAPRAQAKSDAFVARRAAEATAGELIDEALGVVGAQSGPEQLEAAMNRAGAMALAYQWLLSELPTRSEWSYEENLNPTTGAVQRLVVVEEEGLVGPDQHGNQKLHAYEEGLRHWTRLHGELLKTAAAIGLEDRRQRFQQAQVNTITAMIRTLVAGLGRDLDDPEVVPLVQQALRLAAGE